jgi:predicted ArsR family transcriptional regulator
MPSQPRPRRRSTDRRSTDPRALRALAHPLRLRLLELLVLRGPMTATEAADQLGESPANCSFHLRTLAKYGYAEEAGGGHGRQRPWRAVPGGTAIREEDLDIEGKAAAQALGKVLNELQMDRLQDWYATKASYPKTWRTASFETHASVMITSAELDKLGNQMNALIEPFAARYEHPESFPKNALPVSLVAIGFPSAPSRES